MKSGDIVIYKSEVGTVVTDYDNREVMRFLPCNYGTYSTSRLKAIAEDDIREATHEEKLDLIEREYHWGEVVKIHCVGEYQIIEAIKDQKIHYHGYINYKDTNTSYYSLDSALVGCIGRKHEGRNGKAAMYFCKMIGMN
ncbi:hypothetical protein C823_007815 [Eubacterium plexicaudatum ASF492]|uniref:Uncharacterized protein n=1 Tax=Eubacterium plexicaudatum ASF492 TaxID=1235802 RepID=N2A3X5_9FIRM|nr:hypothetical protein C823_007815 [Eubacterium plexicaudatum ASF492]